MKLLTATSQTQGQRDSDFDFCVEGELVIVNGMVCDDDLNDPDHGCGCGRAFAGLNSGKATTTARVTDLDLTPADAREAIRSSLQAGGWGQYLDERDIDELAELNLALAAHFNVGTVLERRLDEVRARH